MPSGPGSRVRRPPSRCYHGRRPVGCNNAIRKARPPIRAIRLPHPERIVALGLALITATLTFAAASGRPVGDAALLHAAVLAGLLPAALWLARHRGASWAITVRGLVVVGVLFFLYGSLGHAVFDAIPWNGDAALAAADRVLGLGTDPALAATVLVDARWRVEALSFFYAAFIPYLYLSIFLGLVGRPPAEREAFIAGFALLYTTAFLGYLFVPARGPIVHLAASYAAPLDGGYFHALVVEAIDGMGGPHGAFPSLHVGASLYAASFDLRHGDPLRGLIYIPLVALIAVATVALRYHYVVDLLAGAALALTAVALAPRLASRAATPGREPLVAPTAAGEGAG